jgi:hypothetical protein
VADWTNDKVKTATETYNAQVKPYVDKNISPIVSQAVDQIKTAANQGIEKLNETAQKLNLPQVEVKVTPRKAAPSKPKPKAAKSTKKNS